jgi:hypothetical protein
MLLTTPRFERALWRYFLSPRCLLNPPQGSRDDDVRFAITSAGFAMPALHRVHELSGGLLGAHPAFNGSCCFFHRGRKRPSRRVAVWTGEKLKFSGGLRQPNT